MKSYEFLKETGIQPIQPLQPVAQKPSTNPTGNEIDQVIDQEQPTQDPQGSPAEQKPGKLYRGAMATMGALGSAADIVTNNMRTGGIQGFASGVGNARKLSKGVAIQSQLPQYNPNAPVEKSVAKYIQQASNGKKLTQATSDPELNKILKAAGLL